MKSDKSNKWLTTLLCGLGLLSTAVACTGCQVTVGGQTLPSPYYLKDDIQYFPEGPEFKLTREAEALEAYKAEQELLGN